MMVSPADFTRVACAISARAAEVLQTEIHVTDDRGNVVAASGTPCGGDEPPSFADGAIRVPLRFDARGGDVFVGPRSDGDEPIPPRLAQALVDLVISEVAIADRLPNQSDLKNRFIYELLRGESTDHAAVLRDARLLGMDLTPPRAVILLDATDFIDPRRPGSDRRAQVVVRSVVGFFHLPDDTICAWNGDGEIAVLKASDTRNLHLWVDRDGDPGPSGASWANLAALKRAGRALLARLRVDTGSDLAIGIGRYHPGIDGLARSYSDARAAISLGRRFQDQDRVHCLDGLGIAALACLSDEDTKIDLARHLLGPLDHEPELLRTLAAWFAEDCSASATAHRLGIHRNTLGYRFDKVVTLTGLDPRHFDEAVQIRLALVLRSLAGAP